MRWSAFGRPSLAAAISLPSRCVLDQPDPCWDVLCEVCIFRSFAPSQPANLDDDCFFLSPTQPRGGAAEPPPSGGATPSGAQVRDRGPPRGTPSAPKLEEASVIDVDDVQPKTPKSCADADADLTLLERPTPPKTSRSGVPAERAEPSNADLMQVVREMMARQGHTCNHMDSMFRMRTNRLDHTEHIVEKMGRQVNALCEKVDNIELANAAMDEEARTIRMRTMEQ